MESRWVLGVRSIPNIPAERAQFRTTLAYRFSPSFQAGLEYNPLAHDLGPIANWRVWSERGARPALILGTSSDRIGTEEGRSYYGTLSKSLKAETSLPIAPYGGVAFGEEEDEWELIGGLVITWADEWNSYHIWDGVNFHNIVETTRFAPHTLGAMLAELDDDYYLGVTYSLAF